MPGYDVMCFDHHEWVVISSEDEGNEIPVF